MKKMTSPEFDTIKQGLPALVPALLGLLALGTLGGCAKDRPYEELLKEQVESKSVISDGLYLYEVSQMESSRSSTISRPMTLGQEKLVRLRFTEKSLDVVEIDSDARFAHNITNGKLVLSIPVEHLEYRCAENSVGECSNKEEENSKITWEKRSKFKPGLDGLKVAELNTLPTQIGKLFGEECASEISSRPLGAKFEQDAINIAVERTFSMNLECAGSLESLSDLTFSEVHHYSLARLDSVASKDYQPVLYPESDQNSFGFFTTTRKELSVDNLDRAAGEKTFLNRWNPARKELTYYLTDNFYKPENAVVLGATRKAVGAINDALAKAGVGFRMNLSEERGKSAGDLRNSMIVMVEDPPALGLLGYGPSVTNPLTGEIVSGRTVMYLGVIKQTIRRTYEEIRKARAEEKVARAKAALKAAAEAAQAAPIDLGTGIKFRPAAGRLSRVNLAEVKALVRDYTKNRSGEADLRSKLRNAEKDCFYSADEFNFSEAVTKGLQEQLGEGDLRPWEELSEAERAKALDVLVPYVWVPTLVHELGHNLGLRHNFQGSEDQENFYTAEELAKMGSEGEIPYSSVMDYAARTLNELHTMGKYDVAALRFGYQRQVELKDGSLTGVPATLTALKGELAGGEDALKPYGFCTDEHVDLNAGCKRFDEGTNLADIARFQIRMYEERYSLRNFRNGARNFSLNGDAGYASRIEDTFYNLRLFLEVRDKIQARFPSLTEKEWAEIPFLKDLDEAVQVTSDFFLRVIGTPDVHCVAVSLENPENIELVKLSTVSEAVGCYDPEFLALAKQAGFMILGQGGKSLHSRKAPSNPSPYADQIDVRGIWIDKLLAERFLLGRELGISLLDETKGSFLEYKDTGAKLKKLLSGIATMKLEGTLQLTFESGNQEEIPFVQPLEIKDQLISRKPESVRRALGLPKGDTLLGRELIRTVMSEVPHMLAGSGAEAFADTFRVASFLPHELSRTPKDFRKAEHGKRTFVALPQNVIAWSVLEELEAVRTLSKVEPKRLAELLTGPAKPADSEGGAAQPGNAESGTEGAQPPKAEPKPELTAEEKAALELPPVLLLKFLKGQLQSEDTYGLILEQVLAPANP
ncbi:MAG: zinc-dependent metalloprotease [Oligoflexia bacterium]|nr:zinc-dependent metalloprotease [Oligoflexia bacterium]